MQNFNMIKMLPRQKVEAVESIVDVFQNLFNRTNEVIIFKVNVLLTYFRNRYGL